jgi:flagellar biosynthesis/type III secretory pathway chaperone
MYISTKTFEDIVQEKIWLLYDFHYLQRPRRKSKNGYACKSRYKRKPDPREKRVRAMLLACGNENRINSAIMGIHTGAYTLDELLETKGF